MRAMKLFSAALIALSLCGSVAAQNRWSIMPDGKTIKVKTYSPLFGISPLTRHLSHRSEPYDQFEMTIN